MKLSDKICSELVPFVYYSGDVLIPRFYVGMYEMDLFRLTKKGFIFEYEIKISRADFKNDFKKGAAVITEDQEHLYKKYNLKRVPAKHNQIISGDRSNRFFFVCPDGLIKPEEVPEYAGLIYFTGGGGIRSGFRIIKNAPLLHKNVFCDWQALCVKLSFREAHLRFKLDKHRPSDKEQGFIVTDL